jgi:hypothetical protein
MKKTIISAAFGVGMVLVTLTPVFAVSSCDNYTTGSLSYNRCMLKAGVQVKIDDLKNSANVVNNLHTSANTGNNANNFNTSSAGDLGLATSNASATTNPVVNALNKNKVAVTSNTVNCETCGVTASNAITGYMSSNSVKVDVSKKVEVEISNHANVVNNISSSANTGFNSSSFNTISGDLITGNASSTVGVINKLNSNDITISL